MFRRQNNSQTFFRHFSARYTDNNSNVGRNFATVGETLALENSRADLLHNMYNIDSKTMRSFRGITKNVEVGRTMLMEDLSWKFQAI